MTGVKFNSMLRRAAPLAVLALAATPGSVAAQQGAGSAPAELLPWPEPAQPGGPGATAAPKAAPNPGPKAAPARAARAAAKPNPQPGPQSAAGGPADAARKGDPPPPRAKKPGRTKRAAAAPTAPSGDVMGCEGPWAKDSTQERIAEAVGAENVVFAQVDGPEGTKLNATVVFPNDPKRRLEVVWHDQTARTRPSSIIVSGESGWIGPRSMRIGAPLTEVEKQNGKPFKLSGFDWDYGGAAGDWANGALAKLPGECVLGVRFAPDENAPAAARTKVSGDQEFVSNSPAVRAVKPRVNEFFLGYPE